MCACGLVCQDLQHLTKYKCTPQRVYHALNDIIGHYQKSIDKKKPTPNLPDLQPHITDGSDFDELSLVLFHYIYNKIMKVVYISNVPTTQGQKVPILNSLSTNSRLTATSTLYARSNDQKEVSICSLILDSVVKPEYRWKLKNSEGYKRYEMYCKSEWYEKEPFLPPQAIPTSQTSFLGHAVVGVTTGSMDNANGLTPLFEHLTRSCNLHVLDAALVEQYANFLKKERLEKGYNRDGSANSDYFPQQMLPHMVQVKMEGSSNKRAKVGGQKVIVIDEDNKDDDLFK